MLAVEAVEEVEVVVRGGEKWQENGLVELSRWRRRRW